MHVLAVRNVEHALYRGSQYLLKEGSRASSRAGDVIVAPGPVTTVYMRPWERVVFDPVRDANPFFHLIESLWMLGGFDDARILDRYVRDFSARFAEDDGRCHGAYGYRWRQHFEHRLSRVGLDQIIAVGDMLNKDITTRRAVLAMWDPISDLDANKKDLPCNTHIYFSGRELDGGVRVLDMTVCNRSNDIIWGAYGANAVHMSILHEVIAGLANASMGVYYQVSNNYHMYTNVQHLLPNELTRENYDQYTVTPVCDPSNSRVDASAILYHAVSVIGQINRGAAFDISTGIYWIDHVIKPMAEAHEMYKHKDYDCAINHLTHKCESTDWASAGIRWIQRRQKKAEEKKNVSSNS